MTVKVPKLAIMVREVNRTHVINIAEIKDGGIEGGKRERTSDLEEEFLAATGSNWEKGLEKYYGI